MVFARLVGALTLALFCGLADAARTCSTINVPACREQIGRDVVFLVDSSESMSPERFYNEMLDYLQSLWCALNTGFVNRGAVITFGSDIRIRIPLNDYTPAQWFSAVDALRSDSSLCCGCCTPTAEAFTAAKNLLTANPLSGARSIVVFAITDGDPWQNEALTPGTIWLFPKYAPASYRYSIVPKEAAKLKSAFFDVRIMLVGVPNRFDNPPATGYFAGVPDPTKRPKGTKNLKRQCVSRKGKKTCANMETPPFPIVSTPVNKNLFSFADWNVSSLLNQTASDLCRIQQSLAPTRSPTTRAPTSAPTQSLVFEGLDLYLFLDRSRSMRWHADVCRQAPGANPDAPDTQVCWQLFTRFTESIVKNATQMKYPVNSGQPFGWQGNRATFQQGVRVWIYGFACTDGQSVPIVERIGEGINNATAFAEAMNYSRSLIPEGGTCPSAAIERALGQIMKDVIVRPYKAAVLITDGVWYDVPAPEIASKGFAQLNVMTYALGIAIPENGNNFGLKPSEIALQKNQLLGFVNGSVDRVYNFGQDGLLLLDNVASDIIAGLPKVVEASYPKVITTPWYCGFSNNERCLNTDPNNFNTAQFCKWIPNNWNNFEGNGRCMDKTWCKWPTKSVCTRDKFCVWKKNSCIAKA